MREMVGWLTLRVSVPVLSEQIVVTEPRVSTAGSRRISATPPTQRGIVRPGPVVSGDLGRDVDGGDHTGDTGAGTAISLPPARPDHRRDSAPLDHPATAAPLPSATGRKLGGLWLVIQLYARARDDGRPEIRREICLPAVRIPMKPPGYTAMLD